MTVTTKPPAPTKRRVKTGAKAEARPAVARSTPPPVSPLEESTSEPRTTALSPDEWPDMSHIVTEDDTPVDNVFSEKQQRLLTETLYASWAGPGDGRPFVALANVGLFYGLNEPPLVPDMLLSLDVRMPDEVFTKPHRSYFVWVYGKAPDVVVEVVSNRKGGEADHKLALYARIGVPYYVIFDPERQLGREVLRVFRLREGSFRRATNGDLPRVGLGVKLWEGVYEDMEATWLRWVDAEGRMIPTGAERAKSAEQRAESAEQRAESAEQRAESAEQRAERLAAQMRALGVEPEG